MGLYYPTVDGYTTFGLFNGQPVDIWIISMSVFVPVSCNFAYYTLEVSFELRNFESSNFVFLFQHCVPFTFVSNKDYGWVLSSGPEK